MSWLEATVRWYTVLLAITWAFAPAVRWLCVALADRGVSVARPIAMLAAVYPAWLLASVGIGPFDARLVAATVLGGALSWVALIRRQGWDREWLRNLIVTEAASPLLFASYVWLRGFTPQILGTEKPMDIAFLASSARTAVMPPPDPWLAGEPINYYYLGYLLHGTVARLAAVPPEIAFNLALATVFSSTAVAAFGIAWNALRPFSDARASAVGGVLAGFAVGLAGNLYAPWRLVQDVRTTVDAWWWDSAVGIGWRSSRIVCDGPRDGNLCSFPAVETINEFPFFSFLLGDLHPHLMAIPVTLVTIALALNFAFHGERAAHPRDWSIRIVIVGAIIGSLYALNAWDYPTFLVLAGVAIWTGVDRRWRSAWKPMALLVASSLIVWLPYFTTYIPPTRGVEELSPLLARLPVIPELLSAFAVHIGEKTSLAEYLTIFGVPYAVGLALVVSGAIQSLGSPSGRGSRALMVATVATVIPGVLLSAPVIPLCGIPLALAIDRLGRLKEVTPRAIALLLFSAAWLLSIGVELVYIRDAFGNRMNTLFKVYYQTWTLAMLAAAIGVVVLWQALSHSPWERVVLAGATAFALLAGAAYPVVASYQWTEGFAQWHGLDGLAYGAATAPDDVAAIRWLSRNAAPGDVVLEAAGCSYRPFSRLPFNRVSAFTGVPTIVGWGDNHQRQWRAGQPGLIAAIGRRQWDVAAIYADPDSEKVDWYGVKWLFVGEYETGSWQAECATAGPYEGPGSSGFPGPGWEPAFTAGETRIYRRSDE